jgi:DNA polymerase I-like protein with 3'-5' exonuclease and polymerase domains
MPIVQTNQLLPSILHPQNHQIYNGLDCCLTFEIFGELQKLFNQEPEIYGFERAMQAPALEMMLRGFLVDQYERQRCAALLKERITHVDSCLQEFAHAVWGRPLNPRSPAQLKSFFYGAMNIPEIWSSQKGVRKLSTNRETLEKIEIYFHAMPIIACIFAMRDMYKQIETLEKDIDPDGRMRTSYNIAGTETGRWSSSLSSTGTGTNLQNIHKDPDSIHAGKKLSLRKIFIADPGKKLCGIDLEQAESREVGWLIWIIFGDSKYLDACESGDLHTLTCRLIWPGMAWTGEPKADRALAEQIFYREFSYRDMSKRGGHGSNYYGTPFTMARHLKVMVKLMRDFQHSYFDAFPGIPRWHQWTATQLQTTQSLTTPFGRERHFYGRPNDDTTLREAIAYSPQSSTGDRLNLALWRIWNHMPEVQLLAQVHDALYFQYDDNGDAEYERDLISRALGYMKTTLIHKGRSFTIPGEAKVGWNWGNYHPETNPDGLTKFKGIDSRKRSTRLEMIL